MFRRPIFWLVMGIALLARLSTAQTIDPAKMSDSWEKSFVGKDSPGKILYLGHTNPTAIALSIHGINAGPAAMLPIINKRLKENFESYTYAWDDHFRRLEDSANDFASQFGELLRAKPSATVVLDTHSMGARMVLVALSRMPQEVLTPHHVILNLIAPTLSGYDSANSAIDAPKIIQELIENVKPGIDMGTKSAFQQEVEAVRFPPTIEAKVFAGENDETAPINPKALAIAKRLGASLQIVDGATHDSILLIDLDALAPYCHGQ